MKRELAKELLTISREDEVPFCRNGGLTLVPLPGFEGLALALKEKIESLNPDKYLNTPVDVVDLRFGIWSNEESNFSRSNEHIVEHDCIIIGSGPMTDPMIMKLLWSINILMGRHAGRVGIFTGYFPHSRSDKDEGEDYLSMLSMLHVNVTGAAAPSTIERWMCFDPHSEQITSTGRPGLVTPIYLTGRLHDFAYEKASHELAQGRHIVRAYPDGSASKRYGSAKKRFHKERGIWLPEVIAEKRRFDSERTEIVNVTGDVDALKGACVEIFDDEIATGGSADDMAEFVKRRGAEKVALVATHPVMCGSAVERFMNSKWVDHIIVTDSIPIYGRPGKFALEPLIDSGRMSVYSTIQDQAEVIYRYHWGKGIRGLR